MRKLDLKALVHILMLVFAGASFFNVWAFFEGAGHNSYAAVALGLALGGALVVAASMLTHIDRDSDPTAYRVVLGVGLGLAVASGALQAAEYAKHLPWLPAVLLGLAIPGLGEVGLAFAYSAYSKARERERFRSVSLTIESAAATVLDEAIQGFDPAPIRKHVDRTLTGLLRAAVDHASVKASAYYVRAEQLPTVQPNAEIEQIEQPVEQIEPSITPNRTGLDAANEQRKADKLSSQREMLDIFRDDPNASYRSVGRKIGRSASTVSSWIDELGKTGAVHVNGNGVEVIE